MGIGVPLVKVHAPTSSPYIQVHEPEYIAIDPNLRNLLLIDQVDDTSDLNKPISLAVQAALALGGGGGGITEYKHTQVIASTVWNIPHNLGRRPTVQIFTTGWAQIIAEVVNVDNNNTQILFDTAQAGFAVLI